MSTAQAKPIPERQLGPSIRRRRKQLGMTLQVLGDRAGVSVGYLSQVERDNATPSLGTLAQIANALDTGLEYFVAAPRPVDSLTRASTRPHFALAGSSMRYESLGADFPGAEMSSFVLHVPPGYVSEEVSHEGEEILYVLDGEIDQTLDGQVIHMGAGDSLHYSGLRPHSWANTTDRPARILWTGTLAVLHRKGGLELPEMIPNDKPT
ncbi:helix-turn-helix domain-containing protein [Tropicimonas sp. IMCC6043]|uniref:helix-turn-helix domain-containing protein n=1 Tax=Tropicimonas sp. IMCC6043 TaxID=2510645 RepID=UPI00101CF307|nr:XRE family transcriptional regulator [Tropicimonas sp. IMCC6043]RYH07146.1 cupin domain-containing protein [Tropicimonas sp. IMCC6043]